MHEIRNSVIYLKKYKMCIKEIKVKENNSALNLNNHGDFFGPRLKHLDYLHFPEYG